MEANRNRLAAEFVERPEFVAKYGGLDNTLYTQELFNTTGISQEQFNSPGANSMAELKQALVNGLTNGAETRASVLRKIVDGTVVISEGNVQFTTPYGQAFYDLEYRRVFVYMECWLLATQSGRGGFQLLVEQAEPVQWRSLPGRNGACIHPVARVSLSLRSTMKGRVSPCVTNWLKPGNRRSLSLRSVCQRSQSCCNPSQKSADIPTHAPAAALYPA